MSSKYCYCRAIVVGTALLGLLWCSWAHAAPPDKPPAKPSLQINDKESNRQQQASAWREFYAGRYEDSVKLCDPLLKSPFEWARVAAQHCQARCYWAVGTKAARARAKQIWASLEKSSTLNSNLERLKIGKALEARANRDLPTITSLLSGVQGRGQPDTCTPEAAIELADYYVEIKGFDRAKQCLRDAIAFIEKQSKVELSSTAAAPFLAEAKLALERIDLKADLGREEFERAEHIFNNGNFAQAIDAYRSVMKQFYPTDYYFRSEMKIGHCLVGLKKSPAALEYWDKFAKASPSGPYRAQAYQAMIDLCLQEMLDASQAGKYADLARELIEEGLKDVHGAASWKAGLFDLQCRIGMVELVRGNSKAAMRAFKEAHDVKEAKGTGNIETLLALVKAGKPVMPDDVLSERDKTASGAIRGKSYTALAVGTVYNIIGDFEHGQRFFNLVLKGMPGAQAQIAYASFGSGAGLEGQGVLEQAKAAFEKSLKTYPAGSWQDETTLRLAMMAQCSVDARFPDLLPSGDRKVPDPTTQKSPTSMPVAKMMAPAERESQVKALQARQAQYAKACQESLPYWMALVEKYPQSRHREFALYQAGRILCCAQRWKEGQDAFAKLLKEFPKSRWAGEACCQLTDIALERNFEFAPAKEYSTAGLDWIKKTSDDQTESNFLAGSWAAMPPDADVRPPADKTAKYRIYMRAGIISFLDRDYANAVQLLTLGKEYFTAPGNIQFLTEPPPMGVERLLLAANKKKGLTPPVALTGDAKVKLILQLADLYYAAEDYDKAISLFTRVADTKDSAASKEQKSWAFFRRARCIYGQDAKTRDLGAAQADYLAAVEQAPKAPWAYDGLFLGANILFNQGMPQKAVDLWRRLVKDYPTCREAKRAAYYIGVGYEAVGKLKEARQTYEKFLKDYPNSQFADVIREYHLKNLEKMDKKAGKPVKPTTLPGENDNVR